MLFEKTYGIDLGSSSVKVYSFFRNKTYIEKNMIASKGHTIIAMGNEAYDMFEKSPTDITVTSPMTFGMIANLELQEIVLYSMIRKIDHILGFGATMYFTVPLDMTAVEKRAYFHVANGHWLKKNRVFMVEALPIPCPTYAPVGLCVNSQVTEYSRCPFPKSVTCTSYLGANWNVKARTSAPGLRRTGLSPHPLITP